MTRMSQVESNEKTTFDSPRNHSSNIRFKPPTFVLPPLNIPAQLPSLSSSSSASLTGNNHPQGFKNFSKATNPFHLPKKPIFFSSFSSPLHPTTFAIASPTVAATGVAAIVVEVVVNEAVVARLSFAVDFYHCRPPLSQASAFTTISLPQSVVVIARFNPCHRRT